MIMYPQRLLRLCICCLCLGLLRCDAGFAQEQSDWQVLRIFVPEEEVGSLVPNDYNPVEIEDLAEALAREATRRTQLQSSPHIAEALYVLRCSPENLVSDQARWSIKSPQKNASLKLEELSVALRNSGSTPADDKPLTPSLRYGTDGSVSLAKISGDTNYWFGMSSVPTATNGNQSTYDMRLPAATMARMLISAPESMKVSSPDVIVTPISNPRDFLPETWPSLATAEGQRWFVIHLSVKSRFRLITETTERKDALAFQHFVRRSSLVYSASEEGLTVSADFEIERLSVTNSLRVLLDKSLRIRSVTVNGASSNYSTVKNSDDTSAFEIPLGNLTSSSARLRIEAISDCIFPFDDVLPAIEIARAFSWEGKTSLLAEDDLAGDQLVLSGRVESAKPRLDTTTIGKRWVSDWIGVPPRLRASIGRIAPTCRTDSFTRLTIQEDWISATTNLRIACSSLATNELRLKIGNGWFIDDLAIEKSDLPITQHLPDGEASDVILTWERLNGEMSINLQLVAHLPKVTNTEQFSLEAPRVVSVIDGVQKDHYAIEHTGRYQIEASPILQRLELSEAELLPWQSQLLSRLIVTQLFQGIGANIPPIVINRSVGTYTAEVVTVARPISEHLQATYSVEILPSSGAIDSANFILNIPHGVDIPSWRVTKELNGEQVPVAKAIVNATREGPDLKSRSQVRFDIQLPDATSTKFVLQSELQLPMQDAADINLPLVTLPVATEAWMILPRNFELPTQSIGIIALPVSVCCDSSNFAKMYDKDVDSMVGYRYDPSIVASVDLHPSLLKPGRGGWIWSDATKHRIYNDGSVAHQSDLQVFAPENMTLVVNLPVGWALDRVSLDGVDSSSGQQLDSQRLAIPIPAGKNVHLSLSATSRRDPLGWFVHAELPKPTFSLASLDSSESLALQPGRIALSEIFRDEPLTIAQRLSPTAWWQWLTPTPRDGDLGSIDVANATSEVWREISLRGQSLESRLYRKTIPESSNAATSSVSMDTKPATATTISALLLFDRSSLCAVCVAILLSGSALSFGLLGDRVSFWWLCLTISLVAVLVIPAAFLGVAHLLLLSLVGGALSRLIRIVTRIRSQPNSTRRGSTVIRAGSNATLMLMIMCGPTLCSAQDTTDSKTSAKFPITYGVLIPLNEDGELSAKHVYAPRKLMNLLNNSDTQDSEGQLPQILGAKYMLKISGGTSLTASYVQEFTAEFDLQFNSTDFALRLPFKSSQLQLLRGSVSGQGVFIGPRLQQTSDAITYRPPETGRVRLRLQLIPTTNGNADRTGIEVDIPRIASSVLDVVADDALDVNIKSIGLVRRLTASSWSAELGPAETLRVDWPARSLRNPMPNQAIVQADSWLHIVEGQIAADCQLRINGARALPKQLHVLLDAAWEPVGTEWNDFKLISNEPTSGGSRRSYLVNRESASDRAVIRVMVVPRNGETVSTLAVPFLSLTESTPTGRTLAISVAGRSRWKLIGSEFWNRLNVSSSDLEWDAGKPALTELWRVPMGAISGSLQRLASDVATVDEACDLQLLSTRTTLDYRATWSQPTDVQVLKLEVPQDAEPQTVRVNGSEVEFQLSDRAERQFMLVNVARIPTEIRLLEVQMQLNRNLTEKASLPRILLRDVVVAKSLYQVNCGAELVCTLSQAENINPDDRLQLSQPVTDPTAMLSTLTAPVGIIDLANRYRDSTGLPLSYQVQRRMPISIGTNAMALARTEQGWRASVEVLLPADQATDFVFFDIPASIRDSIESSGSPYRVTSSGAAGRSTLCLIPQATDNGQYRVKFAYRLPALGSSQSLSIPDVLILGKEVIRPVLALPNQIDDHPVRWLGAGRKLPDDWLLKSGLTLASEDFVYFEMSEAQQQATWRLTEAESNPAEVLFATAVVDEDSDGNMIGAVNYWVDPNNHLDIILNLPQGAQLIGIQAGTSGAIWHEYKSDAVRIVMQPNYLPVQLRVLLRWPQRERVNAISDTFSIQLPSIDAEGTKQMPIAVLSKSILQRAESQTGQSPASDVDLREQMAATQVDALRADRWCKLLLKSLPVVSDLSAAEFVGWMRNWSPEVVGLQSNQALTATSNSPANDRDTVGGFWSWYLEQTTMSKSELRNAEPLDSALVNTEPVQDNAASILFAVDRSSPISSTLSEFPHADVVWYLLDLTNEDSHSVMTLTFENQPQEHATTRLALAAVVLSLTSGMLYLLFRRLGQRTSEILAVHAWLYWIFLASLAWLLLPVAWPSLVIALSAFAMLAGQLMSSRRRQLAMRR